MAFGQKGSSRGFGNLFNKGGSQQWSALPYGFTPDLFQIPDGWEGAPGGDYSVNSSDSIPPPYNLDIVTHSFNPNRPFYCFRSDWERYPVGVAADGTYIMRYNFLREDGEVAQIGDRVATWSNAYQTKEDGSPLADAKAYDVDYSFGDQTSPILTKETYDVPNPYTGVMQQYTFKGLKFNGYSFMDIFGGDLVDFWDGLSGKGGAFDINSSLYSTAGTTNIGDAYKNTGASFLFVIDPERGNQCPLIPGCNYSPGGPAQGDDMPRWKSCVPGDSGHKSRIQTLLRGCNPSNFQWRTEYEFPPLPQMEPIGGVEFYLDGMQTPYWPPIISSGWTGGPGHVGGDDCPGSHPLTDFNVGPTGVGPMIFGPQRFASGGIVGGNEGVNLFGAFQGMGLEDLSLVARRIPCPPNDPASYCIPGPVQPVRHMGLQALLIEYDATTVVEHEQGSYSCRDRRIAGPAVRVFAIGGASWPMLPDWQRRCARFLGRGYGLTEFVDQPWASNDWAVDFQPFTRDFLGPDYPIDYIPKVHLWDEGCYNCADWSNLWSLGDARGNWYDSNSFYPPWSGWRRRTGCTYQGWGSDWQGSWTQGPGGQHSDEEWLVDPPPRNAPAMANATLFHGKTLQLGGTGPTTLDPRVERGRDSGRLAYNGFRGIMYEFMMFEGILSKGDKRSLFKQIFNKYGLALVDNECASGYTVDCPDDPAAGFNPPPLVGPCAGCPCS